MIVIDVSTIVGAAGRRDGVPARAIGHAFSNNETAVSNQVMAEMKDVLWRPRLARFLDEDLRRLLIAQFTHQASWFEVTERVSDCRDVKDNIYLELAIASHAHTIISSDGDLLVLDPWRGVRILTPAAYLARATS